MSAQKSKGWKWEVDIYDRPGWNSFTYNFPEEGGIQKRGNNEIIIRFDTADEKGINDDVYYEHYREVFLSSKDGALTWKEIEPDWKYDIPLELSDGTLLQVVTSNRLRSCEEQKARLEQLGIGDIWRDDCWLRWEMWPSTMESELRKSGLSIWDRKMGGSADYVYLPDGTVATNSPGLVVRKSTDKGNTWSESIIPGLEEGSWARVGPHFAGSVILSDDTILVPCSGVMKDELRKESDLSFDRILLKYKVFALRSEDKGETWQIIDIGARLKGVALNETCLISHPSGRIIAVSRSTASTGDIYCSNSDDGGLSWTPPQATGMQGQPMHTIGLKSGNILCTYTRRPYPAQIRATLSYDEGKTWDLANTKVIREVFLPGDRNGGPGSVQLDDETIFTFYNLARVATPKKEDRFIDHQPLVLNPRFHEYIAGSRYSEDYLRTLGS